MASVSSHLFAAGDIDYINNLNLVRTDVGGLVTEANAKGTMSTQNANAVAITGGSFSGLGDSSLSGWLGIGVPTPTQQLHVAGNMQFENAKYIYSKLSGGSVTRTFGINASNDLYIGSIDSTVGSLIFVNSAERMRIPNASGALLINTTTDNGTDKLQVSGTASATSPAGGANNTQLATTSWVVAKGYLDGSGAIRSTSPTAGVGYATGAGGAVTQTGTLVSSVTLNKMSGVITTVSGGLGVNSRIKFLVSNSGVSATDVVHVTNTGSGTAGVDDNVVVHCCQVVSGGFYVEMWNRGTASTAAGTWVFNFAVIKAVNS